MSDGGEVASLHKKSKEMLKSIQHKEIINKGSVLVMTPKRGKNSDKNSKEGEV